MGDITRLIIRGEGVKDILLIKSVHFQAFPSPLESNIVENLRNNNHLSISLVAQLDDQVVGHIAYSPVYHKGQFSGVGIGPMAVLPQFQGQGIGSRLINRGNQMAIRKGFLKIFVLGEPNFYQRLGFELASEFNYYSRLDPEGKHFMLFHKGLAPEPEPLEIDYCGEFEISD